MTYAVIRFGGRQFKLSEGEKFQIQRQKDSKNEVLVYGDGENTEIGTPVLENYEVKLEKIEDTRDKKIRVGRFKSKSRYRKVKGHKQPISIFKVVSIGKKGAKSEKKAEKKAEQSEVAKDTKVKDAPKKRGRPSKKKEE